MNHLEINGYTLSELLDSKKCEVRHFYNTRIPGHHAEIKVQFKPLTEQQMQMLETAILLDGTKVETTFKDRVVNPPWQVNFPSKIRTISALAYAFADDNDMFFAGAPNIRTADTLRNERVTVQDSLFHNVQILIVEQDIFAPEYWEHKTFNEEAIFCRNCETQCHTVNGYIGISHRVSHSRSPFSPGLINKCARFILKETLPKTYVDKDTARELFNSGVEIYVRLSDTTYVGLSAGCPLDFTDFTFDNLLINYVPLTFDACLAVRKKKTPNLPETFWCYKLSKADAEAVLEKYKMEPKKFYKDLKDYRNQHSDQHSD